ncbi:MAG TPA: hypothetical protein PKM59_08420 [Thermodesulfobacteriota bacterium]|nr:hypothetical protein [Thermodesulfobacteriota bacterium]
MVFSDTIIRDNDSPQYKPESVFQLEVITYRLPIILYPHKTETNVLGLFSRRENAVAIIRDMINSRDKPAHGCQDSDSGSPETDKGHVEQALLFRVTEIRLDTVFEHARHYCWIYSGAGERVFQRSLADLDPFPGCKPEQLSFREGTIVQFSYYEEELRIGIILKAPYTPDEVEYLNIQLRKDVVCSDYEQEEPLVIDQSANGYQIFSEPDSRITDKLSSRHLFTPEYCISKPLGPVDESLKTRLYEEYRYRKGR